MNKSLNIFLTYRPKVVYIVSNIDRWISFEWIVEHNKRWDICIILLNKGESYFEHYLNFTGVDYYKISFVNKFSYPKVILKLNKLFSRIRPDIIHAHFLDATITSMIAGYFSRIKKRIYTRHHGLFHHKFAKKGVLWDKLNNFLSTHIIAVSPLVKKILIEKENVNPSKISVIEHGFDIDVFSAGNTREVDKIKLKYGVEKRYPIIGVIARHVELKGIQHIIPAFKKVLIEYPEAKLLLFNAKGSYKRHIIEMLDELPQTNYQLIEFEEKISLLYHLFDIYVHVPIDSEIEAFGQTYVEALASKVPSIFTLSGIANDFIENRKNALVVSHQNSEEIFHAILELLENQNLRNKITSNGIKDVSERFEISNMMERLDQLYIQK